MHIVEVSGRGIELAAHWLHGESRLAVDSEYSSPLYSRILEGMFVFDTNVSSFIRRPSGTKIAAEPGFEPATSGSVDRRANLDSKPPLNDAI